MADKECINILAQSAFFSRLKKAELELIADSSELATFQDNEYVFRRGSQGTCLFLVASGAVRIIDSLDGQERDIAQFIAGELFGELDLFEQAERTVDAAAETETRLLVFPRSGVSFAELGRQHPALFATILRKLLAQLCTRIREANRLVSEKTPWVEDLRRQILFDKLTGLYNKNYLEDEFKTALPGWGKATSLLAIKPDNFKLINDGYGHEAGDKALRVLADVVKGAIGSEGIGVRFRGDEFVAVLPNHDQAAADVVARKLLTSIPAIDLYPIIKTDAISLSASIGLASYPAYATDVVDRAIELMFDARKQGGNRIASGNA